MLGFRTASGRVRCAAVLALVPLLAGCAQAVGDAYAPVAAVVDGRKIPDDRVIGTLKLQLDPRTSAALGGDGSAAKHLEAERSVLAGLIQTQVMVNEAPRMGVTVADGEVADRITSIRSRFDSEEKFLATLKVAGLDLDGLRQEVRDGLLQDKVAAKASEGAVPEAELRSAYDRNKTLFDAQVHVLHILICGRTDPATGLCAVESQEDMDQAVALAKRARDGADFARLARQFSADKGTADSGGDLGWLSQDRVPPAFGTAIAVLQPGQVSDPVRTTLGVHVVKLVARGRSFEEARDEIEQGIGGERLRNAVNAFLKKVISTAAIKVNPRYGRFDPASQSVVADEFASR
ncbi:MAG TPA: peptidylprolyl isomerase [Actinomycetota bacterium]|jgi:foldase protein PrsA